MHAFVRYLAPMLAIALAVLAWHGPLDLLAQTYSEAGLKRALSAFAAARGLNAVISVIQGTEVTGGALVNVTLALGQVLDPVNDLVEQFSDLMLMVSVVFGVQSLLIQMGATWVISLVLTAVLLVWAGYVLKQGGAPPWLTRFAVVMVVVRFLLPVMAVASELSHRAFMADRYTAGQQAIESAAGDLGDFNGSRGSAAPWWNLQEKFSERMEALKTQADQVVSHVIDLMVLFAVQTVVLPLLMLGAFWAAWRILDRSRRFL